MRGRCFKKGSFWLLWILLPLFAKAPRLMHTCGCTHTHSPKVPRSTEMQTANTCKQNKWFPFSFLSSSLSALLSLLKHLHKAIPWYVLKTSCQIQFGCSITPQIMSQIILSHKQTQNAPKPTSQFSEDPSPSSEGLSKSLSRHDGYWVRSDTAYKSI